MPFSTYKHNGFPYYSNRSLRLCETRIMVLCFCFLVLIYVMIDSNLITINANGGHISMATKKTTTRKVTAKPAAKATGVKRLVRESNPDAHVATGKYRFLLCFMMIAMIIFAGIAVCAMSVAISAINQSAEYEACYMEDENCTLPNKARDKANENSEDNTSYYDSETVVENAEESVN